MVLRIRYRLKDADLVVVAEKNVLLNTKAGAIDKSALNGRVGAEGAGGLSERSTPFTQSGVE